MRSGGRVCGVKLLAALVLTASDHLVFRFSSLVLSSPSAASKNSFNLTEYRLGVSPKASTTFVGPLKKEKMRPAAFTGAHS